MYIKDIVEIDRVKNAKALVDLVRLLAFQIGKEVSLNELGKQVGLDYKTVDRYIMLLEKSFVMFRLTGLSRSLRKDGIRNALISNFNELALRNDVGMLWENFIVMERLKKTTYQSIPTNRYFWRTWDQKEVDLVEEREGRYFGYECKWREKKVTAPNRLKWTRSSDVPARCFRRNRNTHILALRLC